MKKYLIILALAIFTLSCNPSRHEEKRIENVLANAPDAGPAMYDVESSYEFSLGSYKDSTIIKYTVINPAPLMSMEETLDMVQLAVSKWADAVDKPFILVDSFNQANIFFEFTFMDGIGGRLAQATTPPYARIPNWNRPILIDAYDVNRDAEFDPVTIICHELGHGLGLKHSRDPRALMFTVPVSGRRPVLNDQMGMRVLYANKKKFQYSGRTYIAIENTSERMTEDFMMSEFFSVCNEFNHEFHFLDENLIKAAQTIRSYYNQPIAIISSYRCFVCNLVAGGAINSLHKDAQALDWYFVGTGWKKSYDAFLEEVKHQGPLFQTLRKEGIGGFGAYNTAFHIDTRRQGLRRWKGFQYGTWGRFVEDAFMLDPEHPLGIIFHN